MTTYDADLLIAGGGPGGLAAALNARRQGFSVIVAEPRENPIDKACGEGLMPGGVKIQLKAFADHVAREVTAVREMPVTDWERLPAEDEAPESGQA